MKRHCRWPDAEPHGTTDLIQYLIHDDPDTYRRYGRRMVRRIAARCPRCVAVDDRQARLTRIRSAYRRRNR